VVDLLAFRGRIALLAGAASRPVLPVGAIYMRDRLVLGFVISHATTAELAEAAGHQPFVAYRSPCGHGRPRRCR
jgi:hypothetical protein